MVFRVELEKPIQGVVPDDDAKVIMITTNHQQQFEFDSQDGLVLIMSTDEEGGYHLTKLISRWMMQDGSWRFFEEGEEEEHEAYQYYCWFQTFDINENGINELCLQFTIGASGYFPTWLYLFEWNGEGYVNHFIDMPMFTFHDEWSMVLEERPDMEFVFGRKTGWGTKRFFNWQNVGLQLVEVEHEYLLSEICYDWKMGEFKEPILVLQNELDLGPPYKPFD